ncbi:hypothetical protein GCM10017581_105900 [Dactylosporangium matsuzakiense]|uniref:Uncharacterized protein n=1 Tax=Dactylosporangium matsuzakiense TaxID=53360 RepID=A0A9W6KX08_9ACTN|nr:hypothetical protein GCM10017581_105900 [Dactylosporangium matsuzakiense]
MTAPTASPPSPIWAAAASYAVSYLAARLRHRTWTIRFTANVPVSVTRTMSHADGDPSTPRAAHALLDSTQSLK